MAKWFSHVVKRMSAMLMCEDTVAPRGHAWDMGGGRPSPVSIPTRGGAYKQL